jgi:DnaJ-class molecular chaperone
MNHDAYQELNLQHGATEREIKTAFRKLAKEHHPDTSSLGQASADKFRRAYQAYKQLIAQALLKPATPNASTPVSPTPYVFDGQRRMGLDVYLDIALVRPALDENFSLALPWTAYEACPRCLGQGQTLSRLNQESNVYRPQTCPKCQGEGSLKQRKHISVAVTPQMAQAGKFRLREAGAYIPSQAKRGDLIVTLRWVDRLPTGH